MESSKPSPPEPTDNTFSFEALVELMATLRAPDGCPWDRKQTHDSLKPHLLEETYEALEAIDQKDRPQLKEELGDVLLQVVFHSHIAEESKAFTINDVITHLAQKLIRRHPHVFGSGSPSEERLSADTVYAKWEEIKRQERKDAGRPESALDGVPKVLPALLKAYQIQARASRVGFDWSPNQQGLNQAFDKVQEEIVELQEALDIDPTTDSTPSGNATQTSRSRADEDELGDVLFSLVNVARMIKVNPEDALRRATNRFTQRFQLMEDEAKKSGRSFQELSLTEMDELWESAKKTLAEP